MAKRNRMLVRQRWFLKTDPGILAAEIIHRSYTESQNVKQDHQQGPKDTSDSADQDNQPAVPDAQAQQGVGEEENYQTHYGIYDEILKGFEDQESAKDYGYYQYYQAQFDHGN
jgi:hypothetical protein